MSKLTNIFSGDAAPRHVQKGKVISFDKMSNSIESIDSDPAEENISSSSEFDKVSTPYGLKIQDEPFDLNKHMRVKKLGKRKVVAGKFTCDSKGCHGVDASL